MYKYASVFAGFAAINGAFAQLRADSAVPGTPGFGDACHQNGYPKGDIPYPCNEVVEYNTAANAVDDILEHQRLVCDRYHRDNVDGCLKCKVGHGLHSKNEDKYWKGVYDVALAGYCKLEKPTVQFPAFFEKAMNEAGRMPDPGPSGDDQRINSLGGDVRPESYWSGPTVKKPEMAKARASQPATTTVPVQPSRVLVIATQTAKAQASGVSIPKYPTNGTMTSVSASVDAKVSLHIVGYDCNAVVSSKAGVQWQFGSPYYVPSAKVEATSVVNVSVNALATIADASFCGCVPQAVACGQSVVVDGKVQAKACYTAVKPSADGKELVVDEKRTSDKPLPGAGPSSGVSASASASADAKVAVVPYYPAPAICRPECNTGKAEAHASASASASVSGSGSASAHAEAHAEAKVCVVVAAQGDSKVYVPAKYVKNDTIVPPGAPAPLPNTVPVTPAGSHKTAPGSGPVAPAKGSRPDSSNPSPAGGSSPARGAKPADSPVRPVGTGLPIPPPSVPQQPEASVFKGAAAMNMPSLAIVAGILIAAF
ncbi:hypothetical protein CP532_2473 [Ophiocordyceps camponoti-leonardi (nom. inval.)]|nr:hypothetical protein CP532_2473 [Ophiocordyceps camponoti-leonardi (nom. inval.)]